MNSQMSPSETASVVRSCPSVTATTARRLVGLSAARPEPPRAAARTPPGRCRQLDPRLAERLDVAVDRLAVGGDEQDPPGDVARLVDVLADDVVVDHGLVDRDRDGFVGAEEHRVLELALVVDAGDLEGADADAVRREPEPDAAARQLVAR